MNTNARVITATEDTAGHIGDLLTEEGFTLASTIEQDGTYYGFVMIRCEGHDSTVAEYAIVNVVSETEQD